VSAVVTQTGDDGTELPVSFSITKCIPTIILSSI